MPIAMSIPVYFLLLTFPETTTALSERGKHAILDVIVKLSVCRTIHRRESLWTRCKSTNGRHLELACFPSSHVETEHLSFLFLIHLPPNCGCVPGHLLACHSAKRKPSEDVSYDHADFV